jgi:hypothetical protein
MTQTEQDERQWHGLRRARAIVQRYQEQNWRRLRVSDICNDIKRLIDDEIARTAERIGSDRQGSAHFLRVESQ